MTRINEHGQPIGDPVERWTPRQTPSPVVLEGRHVRLEPLAADHAEPLFESLGGEENADLWTYRIDLEAPSSVKETAQLVAHGAAARDHLTFAVVPRSEGEARGLTSLYRIDPDNGSIEVGGIIYARSLQRTPASTEATYLLARHLFDELGYRRLEWKLDSCNEPSAAAARRLGFSYEGRHRNALVYKGRNRDTDWFSIIDAEWPAIRERIETWLDAANFDPTGRQRTSLSELMAR
ncbi:MAG TPA: GNAT family protein [Nocardioides sp.]|nr:GNAT family protein [Nocardioides sp.]